MRRTICLGSRFPPDHEPAPRIDRQLRIAVTGAAGFIGSHLVESLLDGDNEVIGIDCVELIWGLGSIHCLTQQQPKF